jgi:glycosyltransferase involved in cell wall biosynthesis
MSSQQTEQERELERALNQVKKTRQQLRKVQQQLKEAEADGREKLNLIHDLQQRIEKTVSFKYVFRTFVFLVSVKLNMYDFLKRQQAFFHKVYLSLAKQSVSIKRNIYDFLKRERASFNRIYSMIASRVNSLRSPHHDPHEPESELPTVPVLSRGIWPKLLLPRIGLLRHHEPKMISVPKRYTSLRAVDFYPVISIVTPSFNQADFVERTVRSVLDQNYQNLEYIIQDGGSADGTRNLLEKYAKSFFHFESTADKGQANALNIGFRHTRGEIMAYLNSDDLLLPGALHYVANYFVKHPEVDIVYGHRVLIDKDDREIGRWVLPPHDDDILFWADYVPQETLFWRRRIWDRVGGNIDESFQFAMDWDLILRFLDAGARFARLPRFLGAFRVHDLQKTSANLSGIGRQEMERLRQRCHKRVISDDEINKNSRNYLIRHLLYNMLYELRLLRY